MMKYERKEYMYFQTICFYELQISIYSVYVYSRTYYMYTYYYTDDFIFILTTIYKSSKLSFNNFNNNIFLTYSIYCE